VKGYYRSAEATPAATNVESAAMLADHTYETQRVRMQESKEKLSTATRRPYSSCIYMFCCMPVRVHYACLHTFMHVCVQVYIDTYIHAYICSCMFVSVTSLPPVLNV